MATSAVSLCNKALLSIGGKIVTEISPSDGSANANSCAELYPSIRDALLRSHLWNFAIKRVNLAASAEAPLFQYRYQYPLPADFMRLKCVYIGGTPSLYQHKVEGKMILTDQPGPLQVAYIFKETDPTKFDSLFDHLLETALALALLPSIAGIGANSDKLERKLSMLEMKAMIADAQEGSADNLDISSLDLYDGGRDPTIESWYK